MSTSDDQCKVARVGDQYGLDVDTQLLQKRETEGLSLRELENHLGVTLLRRAMEEARIDFVEGDPERYYQTLVGDEATRLEVKQVRRHLNTAGVDVDQVLTDVPSYQSIRHHLSACLGEDTSRNKGNTPSPEHIEDTIRALKTRTERVVAGSIASLHGDSKNNPPILDVHVDITVMCECGRSMNAFSLIRNGCECRT